MKGRVLFGFEIVSATAASALVLTTLAVGCGSDETAGCESTQTCIPSEQGGENSGGSAGSQGGGAGGKGGTSGSGQGGASGTDATGGTGDTGGEAGGGEAGGGGMGGPDETPPTIVSVQPADGATGVLANTNLVITFSEPMDRVTTQAAYQSADIPAAGVTLSWNAASTVLTVNPNSNLPYANGTNSASVTALEFAASITNTAEDAAGNALEQDFDWSFRTARRITQAIPVAGSTGYWNGSDALVQFLTCDETYDVSVGDGGSAGAVHQIFVEADLSSVPTGIIIEWESAELSGEQNLTQGAPFGSLGALNVEHIRVDPISSVTPSTPTRRVLDTFPSAASPATQVADVVAALEDDADELEVSQFRLTFAVRENGDNIDDYLNFSCPTFALDAVYLAR